MFYIINLAAVTQDKYWSSFPCSQIAMTLILNRSCSNFGVKTKVICTIHNVRGKNNTKHVQLILLKVSKLALFGALSSIFIKTACLKRNFHLTKLNNIVAIENGSTLANKKPGVIQRVPLQ